MVLLFFSCLFYYLLAGICISVGYHRTLTHKALQLQTWFERILITIGLPAGTPVQWAGNHRAHHLHTDEDGDPHSPHIRGFWYAHNGWYIGTNNPIICFLYALGGPLRTLFDGYYRPRTNQQYTHLSKDISSVPYYRFISKPLPYFTLVTLQTLLFFGLFYLIWGFTGVLSLWFTLVLVYNFGDAVDSIAHLLGSNPYSQTKHQAKNNWVTGFFAAGEWHANHHEYPSSAKHGLLENQFDLSWQFIRILKFFNIASEIKLPIDGETQINKEAGGR